MKIQNSLLTLLYIDYSVNSHMYHNPWPVISLLSKPVGYRWLLICYSVHAETAKHAVVLASLSSVINPCDFIVMNNQKRELTNKIESVASNQKIINWKWNSNRTYMELEKKQLSVGTLTLLPRTLHVYSKGLSEGELIYIHEENGLVKKMKMYQ